MKLYSRMENQPTTRTTTMNCRNCNATVTSNFCCDCGLPVQINRVDWHYIVHEIQHVLHFEKGILYTIKELLLRPGTSIHAFITTDRSRLVKPVLFIIVTSLIYTTIDHLFHIEQGYVNYNGPKNSPSVLIYNWIQSHYGYTNIIMGIFIALWLKLFYRVQGYNLFEILILLCFVMGMGMLIFSVFAMIEGFTGIHLMQISSILGLSYCTWAIGHFFDKTRVASYFKALGAYILGMATFSLFVFALGMLVDFIAS
jgi:hypothetical protein